MSIAAKLAAAGITSAKKSAMTFLSSGYPVLDHRLSGKYHGGGFPVGRVVEIFGPPSAGKTAISTNVMVAAQRLGGFAMFMDHENSYEPGLAAALGIDDNPERFLWREPDTFEASIDRVFETAMMLRGLEFKDGEYVVAEPPELPWDKPIVCVMDSIPHMTPMSTIVGKKGEARGTGERNMRDNMALAMATSAHLPKLAQLASRTNMLVILLNQPRTGFNKMGQAVETTPGGSAPEFVSSIRLRLTRTIDWSDKEKAKVGQIINCEVIKNKIHSPFEKCSWYYDFNGNGAGKGKFDIVGGVIDELKELNLIESAGAYLVWEGKKLYKSQLVKQIEESGELDKLVGMLPK